MLNNPDCEAQFRRMLQCGIVINMYDKGMFPTPDALKEKYQVVDDKNGKTIDLPHPVAALRVWNAEKQAYDDVSPHLDGAPTAEEKDAAWAKILDDFRESRGHEYINDMLAGDSEMA